MMLKVAVTDIGQLTDFDDDRQKPGPARSSGPAGCLAVVALPLAPGDDIKSPVTVLQPAAGACRRARDLADLRVLHELDAV